MYKEYHFRGSIQHLFLIKPEGRDGPGVAHLSLPDCVV